MWWFGISDTGGQTGGSAGGQQVDRSSCSLAAGMEEMGSEDLRGTCWMFSQELLVLWTACVFFSLLLPVSVLPTFSVTCVWLSS